MPSQAAFPWLDPTGWKQCCRCGSLKLITEFSRDRHNRSGWTASCKVCRYRGISRERWRIYAREFYSRHTERENERYKKWASRNVEHRKKYKKAYYDLHAAEAREYSRIRYHANLERAKQQFRKWVAKNRAYRRLCERTYKATRAFRRKISGGKASRQGIQARIDLWGGLCWICRKPANALDHVKPIAKGGSNWPANLRPICTSCNSRKSDRWAGVEGIEALKERILLRI